MGLITRCPVCGTMFKVVADQLKISEGWVRCGHCAEIFDATADLRDETELELPNVVRDTAPAPAEESVESASSEYPSSVHSEVGEEAIAGQPDAIEIEEQVEAMRSHPLDEPFALRRADTSDIAQAGPHGFSRPSPLEPEPELHDLSFVRQARAREFWRKPGVRFLLVLFLVALAALLAAQVAWQDRDRLAAAYPELRPWLVRMCDAFACRLGPPRNIESVAIETSSFSKLRGDTYRLNVTLRNQAAMAVAMPALELTLTDAQDQAVVRRVLQSAEFAPGVASLGARADWSASLAIAVNASAAGGRIAGYRVLAFYP
ncbi:DUF3426 domain-containing protein [Ramlibacter sp. PS4R-6]|uniref:DUF3426 domain-containing protein n=1 Tax=Ramlibacter sp. PS4R-6 TaxID=3133438 RepID=UPI003098F7FE